MWIKFHENTASPISAEINSKLHKLSGNILVDTNFNTVFDQNHHFKKTFKKSIFQFSISQITFFAFWSRISLKRYLTSTQRARSNEPLFPKIGQLDQKLAKINIQNA